MKSFLSILLVGILFAIGCTERIPRSHLKARSFQLNLQAIRGPVTVDNVGGRPETVVEHFSILGDSVMWIEPESNMAVSIPTIQLGTFTMKDRARGGIWGALIGFGIGGMIGGLFHHDDALDQRRAPLLGAAVGYFGGFAIGSIVGVNTTYIIEP
jgi:hypothetical protein